MRLWKVFLISFVIGLVAFTVFLRADAACPSWRKLTCGEGKAAIKERQERTQRQYEAATRRERYRVEDQSGKTLFTLEREPTGLVTVTEPDGDVVKRFRIEKE